MSFQKQLQKLRKKNKLSQEKLAEIIGISRQAVAKWESGKSYPDIARLVALSNIFNVSIDKLVNDYEENCRLYIEENKKNYITNDIINFLCAAKKSTYKSNEIETHDSKQNSHKILYSKENLKYTRSYVGKKQFIGEESLLKNDVPIWGMNYTGRIIDKGFSINFLKEALSLVPKDHPYRGPMVYQNEEYKYHCIVHGEFEWFNGYEEIFFNDIKVYECNFHGGYIK